MPSLAARLRIDKQTSRYNQNGAYWITLLSVADIMYQFRVTSHPGAGSVLIIQARWRVTGDGGGFES